MENVAAYNRVDPAIEARVEEMLGQMTLAEKVGQLVQVTGSEMPDFEEMMRQAAETGEPPKPEFQPRSGLDADAREGRVGSIFNASDVRLVNEYQRIAIEESRLGIPLIIGSDVIHGYRTIFPIPLAESCTWDMDLLERASRAAAEEASAHGVDWIFAPMVDIARDPRWGRVAEGVGEDPFLGSAIARAHTRGFQATDLESGRRIVACPKHYVAYGAAEAGRDYNVVDISERTLREVYLPPFQAAFDAGAGTTMSAFNEINGVPATADPFALRTILREEWEWPGILASDYNAIAELIEHGVAGDLREAARLAILAGVDMDMMSDAYARHLEALVDDGAVPVEIVDESVRRVLRTKLALGLFEHPYVDEGLAARVVLREDFRELALRVAQESMVLAKNDGSLPLAGGQRRVAVVGPLANSRRDLLGAWVLYGEESDAETVLEAVSDFVGSDHLTHDPGDDIETAVAAARAADVVIAVLGEGHDMSGEARSRAHLGLPGNQQDLLDALALTGKPIVGVLMSGRPLVIPRMAEQVDALLIAWHGGIRAGRAVADIVFGAANPSGKLAMSWPRTEGQIPVYYAHKNTGRPMEGEGTTQFFEPFKSRYIDEANVPLFPFGHGLSYTTFAYSDLVVAPAVAGTDDTLVITATLANTGDRAGTEVAQLYIRDVIASVTRPVKQLKGFERITLQPGESRQVRFEVRVKELGFIGPDMGYVVEPGAFTVWVGPSSAEGLEDAFEVR